VYQPNVEGHGGIVGGVLVGVGDRAILGSVVAVFVGLVIVVVPDVGFEVVAAGFGREDGEAEAFVSRLSIRAERALRASAKSLKDRVSCNCTEAIMEASFSSCVGCVGLATEVTAA